MTGYLLLAAMVVGTVVWQILQVFALGTGVPGIVLALVSMGSFFLFGGHILDLVFLLPADVQKWGTVAAAFGLAVAVLVVRPGETDGRTELPTNAPGKGGKS
jgi:hypothetical protein